MNQGHGGMIEKEQQMLCKLTKVAQALAQQYYLEVKESMTTLEYTPCDIGQWGPGPTRPLQFVLAGLSLETL